MCVELVLITNTNMKPYHYIQDPKQIEAESFAEIRRISALSPLNDMHRQIAMRMIHTCGDPLIIQDLLISANAVEQGIEAIKNGSSIITDVEMLKSGISTMCTNLKHCFINHPEVVTQAQKNKLTRAMAAIDFAKELIPENIFLIGNAPTALFRLLELIQESQSKPHLIIAMPVGFVGAKESKQACWEFCQQQQINCITLKGHKGGSALTVSAYNALCRMARGIFL